MKWLDTEGGLVTGARDRWFFAILDGGWALFDRATDELVAGPWLNDGSDTREHALAAAEAMIMAREPCMPDQRPL